MSNIPNLEVTTRLTKESSPQQVFNQRTSYSPIITIAIGSAISKLSAMVQPPGKYRKKVWLQLYKFQN